MYANDTYQNLTGKKNIVGETFFSVFVQDFPTSPSIASCSTLLGRFKGDVVFVNSMKQEGDFYCKIEVDAIWRNPYNIESGLRYYIVKLRKLD